MSVLAVVATTEPDFHPPRVRVDVTDTGNTPAISSVTVVRVVNGVLSPLRSNEGTPLALDSVSDTVRTGVIYDYEAPFGVEVVYATLQQPDSASELTALDSSVPWLIHLGLPNLSQPVDFRIGSFSTRKRAVRSGVFYPLGRDDAVVVTDGRRKSPESSFTVSTETPEQAAALESLLDDAGVLLLNVPVGMGLMLDTAYIAVGDVDEVRPHDIGEVPLRDWVMPYVQVSMPTGGTPTAWTWTDVMARYPTWADLMDDNRTWAEVLDPTA